METIFAPINNHRNSAVCTVRISGGNIFALQRFIPSLPKAQHRFARRVKIFDADDSQLDDALLLFFKAPNSFTGEDILEVSLHASPFIVAKFLALLSSIEGFRFAKAGEFCLRAVENRKISLDEAEAINKLILSESAVQHRLAVKEMNGICKDYYSTIKADMIKILSLLETFIDFSEEEEIPQDFITSIKTLNKSLVNTLQNTIRFSKRQETYDVQIAILGKPNVGKSTLFNALTSTDDAIVSEIAGTTRDMLKKTLTIAGFKVELVDTAGIRNNAEQIEQIGIERAKKLAENADIILLLKEHINEDIYNLSTTFKGEVITVLTKTDVHGAREDAINVSYNDIAQLEERLHSTLQERFQEMQSVGFLCNARQEAILKRTLGILQGVNFTLEPELLAENFHHALHTISFLVGDINNEDILGEIFSSFCIGK
ncbi:MAG: tRNA uridine-5-carboxymethylaminomethyl(34) synthesis GTPase MnmE [Proteobacteria bacterium]|nr:tRNA uridine-5-carboxymethylaminomethyl(34) synthesis GTPase MnmE [Pseudomonadota bacterium]